MKWEEVSQSEIELAINAAGGDLFKAASIVNMEYPDLIRQVEKSDTLQRIAEEAKHVRVKPKVPSVKDLRPHLEQSKPVKARPRAGSINTRILVISDTHAPYHHPATLDFLKDLHAKHKFTRIIHIGDEADFHFASYHEKDPDLLSPREELHEARVFLHALERIFPQMDVIKSNHGNLAERKLKTMGLPSEMLMSRAALYMLGDGWHFHDKLILTLPSGYKCMFVHGRAKNYDNASRAAGMSLVQGHHHTEMGIKFRHTTDALHFGMGVGCLIDRKNPAFTYASNNKDDQTIGCGMILNGVPAIAPMFLDNDGNWTGVVP